jgi:MIZ/SP-RING zinc finger
MYCCSCCYCYCYCCYDADELLATSTRLSLRCPLGLVPVTVPGRGARCTHLQCFDLTTFLSFNEKNRCVCACCIPSLSLSIYTYIHALYYPHNEFSICTRALLIAMYSALTHACMRCIVAAVLHCTLTVVCSADCLHVAYSNCLYSERYCHHNSVVCYVLLKCYYSYADYIRCPIVHCVYYHLQWCWLALLCVQLQH